MRSLKFQRGALIVLVAVAVGLTSLIGGLFIKSVQESQSKIDPLFEGGDRGILNATEAQLDAATRATAAKFKAAQLTGVAINLGTGADAGDLTAIVAGKITDKVIQSGMDAPICPAPKQMNTENLVAPQDGGQALNAISSGVLAQMMVTQAVCGTGSNPLPSDVGAAPIAGCTTGAFVCGNGNLICRDKTCNGSNECGDNSDEGSNMCNSTQSCCQVTNGCPGETGSDCGSSCCCCPIGQACDRVNPGRGCVPSD